MEILLHQALIHFRDGLNQVLKRLFGLCLQLLRDIIPHDLRVDVVALPRDLFHRHKIDQSPEFILGSDGKLNRHRIRAQFLAQARDREVEVGPYAIHLVDEGDTGDAVLIGLAPDRFGLGLDTGHGAEHRHSAVKHAQAALYLGGEVHVTGRVDNVDPVVVPLARRRRSGDGDAAFLLLLHVIHGRSAVMDLAHAVQSAGIVQDTLRHGGLAGINVGHDPDVSDFIQRMFPRHCSISLFCVRYNSKTRS